jgi:DNA polymerase III epsilon subunit family exonuclease
MNNSIDDVEFTIFDTETTGLDPVGGDRIIEIAAFRVKGREVLSTFSTLVNPHRPVSSAAYAVNKISSAMLQGAPDMQAVLPGFIKFIEGSCLCSYNAGFDLGFLNNELRLAQEGQLKGVVVADILKMAKRLLPGFPRHALWFVAEQLGVKIKQEHRALSDVELTFSVFNILKERLSSKGIDDITNFTRLFAMPSEFLSDIHSQTAARIQEAIDLGVKMKIKYLASSNAEVTEREVIPKLIKQDRNTLYLVGYCCLRNQEREFRIDGILHTQVV